MTITGPSTTITTTVAPNGGATASGLGTPSETISVIVDGVITITAVIVPDGIATIGELGSELPCSALPPRAITTADVNGQWSSSHCHGGGDGILSHTVPCTVLDGVVVTETVNGVVVTGSITNGGLTLAGAPGASHTTTVTDYFSTETIIASGEVWNTDCFVMTPSILFTEITDTMTSTTSVVTSVSGEAITETFDGHNHLLPRNVPVYYENEVREMPS
ncbi:hypothetical protein BZG36_05690 [Bifiguratus adelaidae]|uniref:Uncharacterized protein n=1 Tax=Bifiguratus adelaidae TaxID=1938954 RepID=A0A261XT75_9FUNG|nr:hypothetical protein BZG36_05690 [Bifiguratus adelaidae]